MVSDFITEKDGYLRLTEEEYQAAKEKNPGIRKAAGSSLNTGSLGRGIGPLKSS